ncbi:hypothetical protein CHS0354_018098 [Potamilus streckersoni]|uniref:Neurotransmitter-gated ion-channel ligand-binding domain-containing protein n=1 Tax=Potamilus streckersoni TaxID=2493646 RepID=A0AAE0TKD7_9BIVA|nr:hypothetical protein CHS0354_018098 [Potamilus streckersoni]KAK3611584.1 hypothetical protein CHS0354_018098 [Potamilus streckersoni]
MEISTWILPIITGLNLFSRCTTSSAGQPRSYAEETVQIYNTIFHKYNAMIRPAVDFPKPEYVDIDLTLIQVRNLDLKNKELDIICDISLSWMDPRLFWYPQKVKKITANSSAVWTPDVSILNALSAPENILNPDLVAKNSGMLYWYRRQRLRTACHTNSSVDVQDCQIIMGSKLQTSAEQDFRRVTFNVNSDVVTDSWEVVGSDFGPVPRYMDLNNTLPGNFTEMHFILTLQKVASPYEEFQAQRTSGYAAFCIYPQTFLLFLVNGMRILYQ